MGTVGRPPMLRSLATAIAALGLATGCEIVEGLGDAGRAIFPEHATYVNAPGSRLAAGNYAELDFTGVWLGAGTIGFKLLARTATPGDDSLSVIGFTNGSVCRVEHVGAYRSSTIAGTGEVMLSYLDGPGPRGTLRFVDPECEPLPAVVPDAALSSATMPDGRRIVVSGDDLVLVDPTTGVIEPFETDVVRIDTRSAGPYFVQAGGELAVYDDHWRLLGRYGEGVVTFGFAAVSGKVAFEDANGISAAVPGGAAFSIAKGACELGFPSWQPYFVTVRQPCSDGHALAVRIDLTDTVDLGPDIDARNVQFWMEATESAPRRWVTHFRDYDPEADLGTLVLRAEDGGDLVIGERSAPGWVDPRANGREGYALINADGDVGDFVEFDTRGGVRVIADRVLRYAEYGVMAHFDGVAGDMGGIDSEGRFVPLLTRVPPDLATYLNRNGTLGAALTDFDGRTGTLSTFTSYLDLHPVATGVLHPRHGFIDSMFPGMAWIRADGSGDTGTLEYQNTELVYTATVSEGVSSFLPTTEGLIYTVPRGASAGVWFAEAK